jgi:hypothetical protein
LSGNGQPISSSVKYPEAIDRQGKMSDFRQKDLPEIGVWAWIFLQILR